jgi:hypothetical protein
MSGQPTPTSPDEKGVPPTPGPLKPYPVNNPPGGPLPGEAPDYLPPAPDGPPKQI